MGKKQKHKKKNPVDNLTQKVSSQCKISTQPGPAPPDPGKTVLYEEINPELLAKWPKLKLKVPPIFLHQPVDFEQHVKKVLNLNIKFFNPHRGRNYTRIVCQTFSDHKYLMQYFDKKQLPYHTFGNPSKRKMKVVIKGLPFGLDLASIKDALKSVSVPVIRVHEMQNRTGRGGETMLVLAVVPYDDNGKSILKVKELLGHEVILEPPKDKLRQCHRCQKWGHSQRYCHGDIKCVKCAGEHLTNKCAKTAEENPNCANCNEAHTASYRKCKFAQASEEYEMMRDLQILFPCYKQRALVTLDNYHMLYKNVDYNKKSTRV